MDEEEKMLELALNQLFSSRVDHNQKMAIENELRKFESKAGSVEKCAHILRGDLGGELLQMFCLHCIQELIRKRWHSQAESSRRQLRCFLLELMSRHRCLRFSSVAVKLMTTLADVGRLDWPDKFPEYSDLISNLLKDDNTAVFGAKFVSVSVEQFCDTSRFPLLSRRKQHAKAAQFRCFVQQLFPRLVELTCSHCLLLCRSLYAADDVGSAVEQPLVSFVRSRLSQAPPTAETRSKYLDTAEQSSLVKYLELWRTLFEYDCCLPPFFSNDALSLRCLDGISALVLLGCRASSAHLNPISKEAAAALAELASRPLLVGIGQCGAEFSHLLLKLVVSFMEEIVRCARPAVALLEATRSVVLAFSRQHFPRLSTEAAFELKFRFLQLLLELTSNKEGQLNSHLVWLPVWDSLCDEFSLSVDWSNNNNTGMLVDKLEILAKLPSFLLDKVDISGSLAPFRGLYDLPYEAINLFGPNSEPDEEAESYGDASLDSWLAVVKDISKTMLKVSNLCPLETVESLWRRLDHLLSTDFLQQIKSQSEWNENSLESLARYIGQLQTFVFLQSSLSHLLLANSGTQQAENVRRTAVLLEQRLLCWSTDLWTLISQLPSADIRHPLLSKGLTGLLLCLRSNCHWLSHFYSEAQRSGEHVVESSSFITAQLDVTIAIILKFMADRKVDVGKQEYETGLFEAALALLYSLLVTVRPRSFVLSSAGVASLFNFVCVEGDRAPLSAQQRRLLYTSLANYLLLPWHNSADSEQDWPARKRMYAALFDAATRRLRRTSEALSENKAPAEALVSELAFICPVLSEMLSSIRDERVLTKKMASGQFVPLIDALVRQMASCRLSQAALEPIMRLLDEAFGSLVVQFGGPFTEFVVGTLLNLTSSQGTEGNLTSLTLISLLKLLTSVTREMSKAFLKLVDGIYDIAVHNLYRLVDSSAGDTSPDAKEAYFALLFSLLFNRWRYFFPNSIAVGGDGIVNTAVDEENDQSQISQWTEPPRSNDAGVQLLAERGAKLVNILEIVGRSMQMESHPSLLKANLTRLVELQHKWGLFSKPVFLTHLPSFCQVLLNLMLTNRFPMVEEEIEEALFAMVSTSQDSTTIFTQMFLPNWLHKHGLSAAVLLDSWKVESDIAGFSETLHGLLVHVRLAQVDATSY